MAKKKAEAPVVSQEEKKPSPARKKVEKLEITTLDEAKKHIEKSYKSLLKNVKDPKSPFDIQFTVLSNGHVFYGINNGAAKQVAKNYGLKRFEVTF